VERARTARTLIKKAEQLKPDLVILDLTMPKMNGLQVARAIKKLLPKVRLVLFSLEENQFIRDAANAAGISARGLEARWQSKSVPRLANGAAVGGLMVVLFS
jgi:DNA-binding NarL/FixJ family response regulator